MAWFNHVSLGSAQQQQLATGSRSFTASDALSSSLSSGFEGPTEAPLTVASHHWTGSSAPRPVDFPSAPRGLGSPPSLENLTCSSFGAAQTRDPEPISYVSLQEQRCVLSWFQGWTPAQRERFLQDLLGKAVPGKICTLLDSLSTLQVPHAFSPPNFQSHAQRCAPSNTKSSLCLTRSRTNYQTSLSASCACGVSGLSPGARRRGITFCTCWRNGSQCLSPTFTGVWREQLEKTEQCLGCVGKENVKDFRRGLKRNHFISVMFDSCFFFQGCFALSDFFCIAFIKCQAFFKVCQ